MSPTWIGWKSVGVLVEGDISEVGLLLGGYYSKVVMVVVEEQRGI